MTSFLFLVARLMVAFSISSVTESKLHYGVLGGNHNVVHRQAERHAQPLDAEQAVAHNLMRRDVTCVSDDIATILSTQAGASSFCNYYTGAEQQTIFVYTTPIVTTTVVTASIQDTVTRFFQTTCAYTTTIPAKHKRQPQITPAARYRRDAVTDNMVGVVVKEVVKRNDSITPESSLFSSVASALYSACTCADYPDPAPTTITTNDTAITSTAFARIVKNKITTTSTLCINRTVTVVAAASSDFTPARSTVAVIPIPLPTPVTAVGNDVQCPHDNNMQTYVLIGPVLYAWRVLCDVDITDSDISRSHVSTAGDCEAACGSINDAVKSPLCKGWVFTNNETTPYNCFSKANIGNRVARPGVISGVLEMVQVAPNTTFSNNTSNITDISPIVSVVVNNNNTLLPPHSSCSGVTSGFGTTIASTWTNSAGLTEWTSYYTWSTNWFQACYTTWSTVMATTITAVYATSTGGAGSGSGSGSGVSGSDSGSNGSGGVISGSAATAAASSALPMVTSTALSGGSGGGGGGNFTIVTVINGTVLTSVLASNVSGATAGGSQAGGILPVFLTSSEQVQLSTTTIVTNQTTYVTVVTVQASGGNAGGNAAGGVLTPLSTYATMSGNTSLTGSINATSASGYNASGAAAGEVLQTPLSSGVVFVNSSIETSIASMMESGNNAGGTAAGGVITATSIVNITAWSNASTSMIAHPTPPPGNKYYLPPPFTISAATFNNNSSSIIAGTTLNVTTLSWLNETKSTAAWSSENPSPSTSPYDITALPIQFDRSTSSYSTASSMCPCDSAIPTMTVTASCAGMVTRTVYETVYTGACLTPSEPVSLASASMPGALTTI